MNVISKPGRYKESPSEVPNVDSSHETSYQAGTLSSENIPVHLEGDRRLITVDSDQDDPMHALPRSLDDFPSHSSLALLFPHLSSDLIEEWVQICKPSRDRFYIGEEVKSSIFQDYEIKYEPETCDMTIKQNARHDGNAENRQKQDPEDPDGRMDS
jgi:hypothetical protein